MSDYSALHAVMTHPSMVDYPGRMAVLFFTQGCNFHCGFCHNPNLLSCAEQVKTYSWADLEALCQRYKRQWVTAATITGGEPTLHPELGETVDFLKDHGFSVKLDTNGSNPNMLERLLPKLDYVAMDMKCSLENYAKFVGFGNTAAIRASIAILLHSNKDYEFRTTLMEGVDGIHDDDDLNRAGEELRGGKRWIFQPFLPHENLPEPMFRTLLRTRPSVLQHAAEIGAKYVDEACVRGK